MSLSFYFPTPAVRLKGWTLFSPGGPCLSAASWSALPLPASDPSDQAGRGVNGFGSFCRNKRASPAGAKPGTTEHHVDTRVGATRAVCSPASTFMLAIPRWIPDTHRRAEKPEPLILIDPKNRSQKWRQTFMNVLQAFSRRTRRGGSFLIFGGRVATTRLGHLRRTAGLRDVPNIHSLL